jgi:hypothetical protein
MSGDVVYTLDLGAELDAELGGEPGDLPAPDGNGVQR